MTLSGGSIAAGTTVPPDSSDQYDDAVSSALFIWGQSLTVSASGSTVPAFGAQTVVAPNPIALASPALAADGGTSTVSTASNLTVTWVGGQAGATVTLEGAGDTTQTPFVYFVCNWDSSLGTGTIPQAMLTPLAGQSAGVLFYGQYTSHDFTAGSYSISEYALPYASSPVNFE